MELLELVGDKADIASKAIALVESSIGKTSPRETLSHLDKAEKFRIIQGLCAILYVRSYSRFDSHDENPAEVLVSFIRESVEWEGDKGREGVHARYQALNVLETAIRCELDLFFRQLTMLEKDQRYTSLALPDRGIDNVIIELVNWFREYSWHGYGKTGPENCQEALALVRNDISYLLDNGNIRNRN